jgi:hypothetical protein
MISFCFFALQLSLPLAVITVVRAATTQANQIATLYSPTSSTSLPFPTAPWPPANASTFLSKNDPWSLVEQNGGNYMSFVADPFDPSDTANPVFQVRESQFSLRTNNLIHTSINPGSLHRSLVWWPYRYSVHQSISEPSRDQHELLKYLSINATLLRCSFQPKLSMGSRRKTARPPRRPDMNDCDGGLEPKGNDCFSTRLMGRVDGAGEVYAYVQTPDGFCNETGVYSVSPIDVTHGNCSIVTCRHYMQF